MDSNDKSALGREKRFSTFFCCYFTFLGPDFLFVCSSDELSETWNVLDTLFSRPPQPGKSDGSRGVGPPADEVTRCLVYSFSAGAGIRPPLGEAIVLQFLRNLVYGACGLNPAT